MEIMSICEENDGEINSLLALYDLELDVPGKFELPDNKQVQTTPVNDQWLKIIDLIEVSGSWNKDNCQIRVNTSWNFELLEQLLHDYHD